MVHRAVISTVSAAVALILAHAAAAHDDDGHHRGHDGIAQPHRADADRNFRCRRSGLGRDRRLRCADRSGCSWSMPRPRRSTFSTCATRSVRSSSRPSTPRRSARQTAWRCTTGVVAVAHRERSENRSGPRRVLHDAAASCITSVQVGALPDMVTFTPDGDYVLSRQRRRAERLRRGPRRSGRLGQHHSAFRTEPNDW